MRADRQQVGFCVLRLILIGDSRRKTEVRRFAKLMAENVRATDKKAQTSRFVVSLLLVDTSENGGQSAANRLEAVSLGNGFSTRFELKSYIPHVPSELKIPGQNRRTSDRKLDESDRDDLDDDDSGSFSGTSGMEGSQVMTDGRRLRIDTPVGADFSRPGTFRIVSKRLIDIAVASIGLIFAAPVLAAAMVAIRATSDGPAIFTQSREGFGGRVFKIYKLRTMFRDAESRLESFRELNERDGPAFKMQDDPRVTRVVYFLRSTCIDELPQLLNVLKGEMSLVDRGGLIVDFWLMLRTLRVPMGGRGGD
jgi:hypothetical protein